VPRCGNDGEGDVADGEGDDRRSVIAVLLVILPGVAGPLCGRSRVETDVLKTCCFE
jgi:hypothetical protein